MKSIKLTEKQRQEIQQLRRQANDRRLYQRLSALLWIDEGCTREEVAQRLDVSSRQVGDWLRIFRNKGLKELCTLHYKGDPGKLKPAQMEKLKEEIAKGGFHNARQVCDWIKETFAVEYSPSGVKDLLRRCGASYHKVSGFFWKADRDKQRQFVKKYRRHQREQRQAAEAGEEIRHYFVDACHPIWGLEMLYCCWLLVGQRYYVGVGSGRKRLNILGAYCREDHDYVDIRLHKKDDNINGERFVELMEKLLAKHPKVKKFILYLDNAGYYKKPLVKEWLSKHSQFHLIHVPAYSPNLNLIERLWKFLRKKAFQRWHKSFEEMQQAVADVLDNLKDYKSDLDTLMTDKFSILSDDEVTTLIPA
jgi:transposase